MKFKIKGLDSQPTLDELYDKFLAEEKEFCSVRDNCDQCAYELSQLFNDNGYQTRIVRGEFRFDNPVNLPLDLKDLYPKERKAFLAEYKGKVKRSNLSQTIFDYATREGFVEELYYMPHTWVEVDDIIFDPSVYQFMGAVEKDITEDNYRLRERT